MGKPLLTKAQWSAVKWLKERGGDAVFDKYGIALAQGETAPVMRSTWNALSDLGLIHFYGGANDGGRGYGRLRLVPGPVERTAIAAAAREGGDAQQAPGNAPQSGAESASPDPKRIA